jgi:hypothetical protein
MEYMKYQAALSPQHSSKRALTSDSLVAIVGVLSLFGFALAASLPFMG